MLIFLNGNNELNKKKIIEKIKKESKSENVKILEYQNVYDKIFKILKVSNNSNFIYVIKNSLEKDFEYLKTKTNLGYLDESKLELFEKYYSYYHKNQKLTKDEIKYYNCSNINKTLYDISKYIQFRKKAEKYEELKWLTGC